MGQTINWFLQYAPELLNKILTRGYYSGHKGHINVEIFMIYYAM